MPVKLPILFPSEAVRLRQRAEAVRELTPAERLLAVVDALAAAETLSIAGGRRDAQLEYHRQCEEQWHHRMREFISEHVDSTSTSAR